MHRLILAKEFIEKKCTLGLAESCTGGYIAHHITQVMGSADYFKGSIVCYSALIKHSVLGVSPNTIEQFGVVSEETAIEMVHGARKVLHADYALSVTGQLSPGGNNSTPVGTVWMAVVDKKTVKTKKYQFHYDRIRNKEMAVQMAMLMIWKFINNKL